MDEAVEKKLRSLKAVQQMMDITSARMWETRNGILKCVVDTRDKLIETGHINDGAEEADYQTFAAKHLTETFCTMTDDALQVVPTHDLLRLMETEKRVGDKVQEGFVMYPEMGLKQLLAFKIANSHMYMATNGGDEMGDEASREATFDKYLKELSVLIESPLMPLPQLDSWKEAVALFEIGKSPIFPRELNDTDKG